ncbi:MAG: hypothetical protein OEY56_03440 [Cyclobacteriaceae bacterium]|nr:hypothetical protein [Cyclobacteriaceae bacterium]
MIEKLSALFEKAELAWSNRMAARIISNLLILSFLAGLLVSFLSYFQLFDLPRSSFFLSIDVAFTVLLIFEVLGLVFLLPKSVADSVGKQFEILSIIFLRSAFKEFGKQEGMILWDHLSSPGFYYMFYDAFGALLIFLVIGFYYRAQKHTPITDNDEERHQFIRFKQLLAMMILILFFAFGIYDLYQLYLNKTYYSSINSFYLFLIFTDILILLYSLRYTTRYLNIFRYSSFAFATVLIRLALSAGPLINVVIGLIAGLFVLGLSYAYNYFRRAEVL